jgi:hypothetical protein
MSESDCAVVQERGTWSSSIRTSKNTKSPVGKEKLWIPDGSKSFDTHSTYFDLALGIFYKFCLCIVQWFSNCVPRENRKCAKNFCSKRKFCTIFVPVLYVVMHLKLCIFKVHFLAFVGIVARLNLGDILCAANHKTLRATCVVRPYTKIEF